MDVYSTVMIPFTTAVLGGEAVVQTLTGRVVCKINPGTQSGTRIRLKGKGVPSLRNKEVRGDHYVTLIVNTPTGLSKEAKDALRKFDELSGGSLTKEGGAASTHKKKGFMDKLKESLDDL